MKLYSVLLVLLLSIPSVAHAASQSCATLHVKSNKAQDTFIKNDGAVLKSQQKQKSMTNAQKAAFLKRMNTVLSVQTSYLQCELKTEKNPKLKDAYKKAIQRNTLGIQQNSNGIKAFSARR